jgi:hypothetical protein
MGHGLQRAANAASESRRRGTGKPAKPWRVYGEGDASKDCRSQTAAYEVVRQLADRGNTATVWQWDRGQWVLYEVIDPGEI